MMVSNISLQSNSTYSFTMNQYRIIYLSWLYWTQPQRSRRRRLLCVDTIFGFACVFFVRCICYVKNWITIWYACRVGTGLSSLRTLDFQFMSYLGIFQLREPRLVNRVYIWWAFFACIIWCAGCVCAYRQHGNHVPCVYDSIFDWIQWTPCVCVCSCVCMRELSKFSRSPAFSLSVSQLCLFTLSLHCFDNMLFLCMNGGYFECGAAIDLIVWNENWTRIYRCYVIHRGIG